MILQLTLNKGINISNMFYNHNGETFKLLNEGNKFKLYHKAVNQWSSGWTYIGSFVSRDKAEASARLYSR